MDRDDYDLAFWEFALKTAQTATSADLMNEGFQLTLYEIRCLDETWRCPYEEKP